MFFCCKEPQVDLWNYFNGVEDKLWKYSQRGEDKFWKIIPKIEKWLIDLKEAIHSLYHCWKKVLFRPLQVLSWGFIWL